VAHPNSVMTRPKEWHLSGVGPFTPYPEEPQMDLALEIMDVVDVLPTCHA
jgi:hypothetical protein